MKHLRKLIFLLPLSLLLIGCGKAKTNGSTTKKDDNTTTKSDLKTTTKDSEKTTTKKTTKQQTTTKDDSEQEYNLYHVFDLNGVEVVKDKKI